jgi:DNA replication licensing factor MCM2
MEQQSISISKAGIVTTLRARCSVIAAANPLQGRYNSQISFKDNVDLSEPILSRFDILNVIKDEVNEDIDYDLSTFVINSHIANHPYLDKYDIIAEKLEEKADNRPYVNMEKLKNYIKYAREKCQPVLPSKNIEIVEQFYIKLRESSLKHGGMNIAVRHIESIIRVSTGKYLY